MEKQIEQIGEHIKPIVNRFNSPIMAIPNISNRMVAIIIAETNNFSNLESAKKVFTFTSLEPSVYQSCQLISTHTKMVKHSSKYF